MKGWEWGSGEKVDEVSILDRTEEELIKVIGQREMLLEMCLECFEWHSQYPFSNNVFETATSEKLREGLDWVIRKVRGG